MVTVNLSGVSDGWFEGRRDALVAGVRALQADVVCMQEVSSRGAPYPYDQVLDLSERLSLPYASFAPYGNPNEIKSRERGGLALLCRYPLRQNETLPLPPGPMPPDARVAVLGSVQHPRGDVQVVGLHLSWPLDAIEARAAQASYVVGRVRDLRWEVPGHRFVLAGDLNAVETEPAIALFRSYWQDVYRTKHPERAGLSWTHENPLVWYPAPDRRVDYIFADSSAEIVETDLALTDPVAPATDHYAVYAHLRWPES